MKQLSLYWNTLRYLRPVQIFGRVGFRLARPRPDTRPAPLRAPVKGAPVVFAWRAPSLLDATVMRLLGKDGVVASAADWNDSARSALWLYHAHYFDDLTAAESAQRHQLQSELVDRWIEENPPAAGIGWAPYPTSLRLVNWIFWLLANPDAASAARVQSVAVQTRHLARRLEHHILGNHLLANAKALVFSGLFFAGPEADEWYRVGMALLERELAEQILTDGGHFERSPMYHNTILADLLDLHNLHGAFGRPVPASWAGLVGGMLEWAAVMTLPDGDISLFNDAALDHAPDLSRLLDYAQALGLSTPSALPDDLAALPASGYVRLSRARATVIADIGPLGPDYLPAHGHADTLSFELCLDKDRIVVNGGTSLYGVDGERLRQRGTANHSTLMLDEQNSSEVWSGFRVARRAKILAAEWGRTGEALWAKGSHDGYRRLAGKPIHERQWTLSDDGLKVMDVVSGSGEHAVAILFHLPPGITPRPEDDGSILLWHEKDQRVVARALSSAPLQLSGAPSTWHPRFGQSLPNHCLHVDITGALPIRHSMTFTWAPT